MQGGNSAFEGFGSRPAVVVTLHSGDLLRRASGSAASLGGDLIEVRLDALAPQSEALAEHLPEIAKSIPLILTARYPSEGGEGKLTWKTRRSLIDRFVEFAFAVDIEARSLDAAGGWLEELRSAGMKLVVSHHDFEGLPENGRIEEAVARAAESGADVAKLAYRLENPQHLSRLLRVFCAEKRLPLAGSRARAVLAFRIPPLFETAPKPFQTRQSPFQ